MNVSNMLTGSEAQPNPRLSGGMTSPQHARHYTTRQAHHMPNPINTTGLDLSPPYNQPVSNYRVAPPMASPSKGLAKQITFQLMLPEFAEQKARLPMRVNIYPNDPTDDIITTVKNFYGLYVGKGVSFEDASGITMIARYENFDDNMKVYVRVVHDDIDGEQGSMHSFRQSISPQKAPRLDEPIQMQPSQSHPWSRPSSRTARLRSDSPQIPNGRRSNSTSTVSKVRSRPGPKSRGGSFREDTVESHDDELDSDADGSVSSSRRGKTELVSAEISLENIVEGGRRKRANPFDSSELPLFVPPQLPMPASASSVSPQRRIGSHNGASPFSYPNQHTFAYGQPLPSPQSYGQYSGQGDASNQHGSAMSTPYSSGQPHGHRLRTRGSGPYAQPRHSLNGSAIMPTPDPTIGSVISDEDVALQLMRLGDASNFSSHGRTSTSTLDDALSGKAEAASSDEESDDEEGDEHLPAGSGYALAPHGMHDANGSARSSSEDYDDVRDGSFRGSDGILPDEHNGARKIGPPIKKIRTGSSTFKPLGKPIKQRSSSAKVKTKHVNGSKVPISPTSLPPQSRKTSIVSAASTMPLGPDEEDLSAKPRCQRCRKSKKGCDRQRPCGRCKDAGIGVEGCVSEDEGNGRKGRYGRHMGVVVKKDSMEEVDEGDLQAIPPAPLGSMAAPPIPNLANKTRKR